MNKEEIPLEPKDIRKLKLQLLPLMIFPAALIAILSFIFNFVLDGADDFMTYPFLAVGVFILGIIVFMAYSFITDIRGGIKHRISGAVTDKRLNVSSKTRAGQHRSSRTTKSYFLYIDHEEFQVDYKDYSKTRVGNEVIIEKAPKSKLTLFLKVLDQKDELLPTEHQHKDNAYLRTKMQETLFSEADTLALKKGLQTDLRRKITWMLPFAFFIFTIVGSEFTSLLIVLFPLVIIPGVQMFLIVKRVLTYFKDKAHGYKEGITAMVEDKLTITSNRHANKNTVRTTWKPLQVSTVLYDKLEPGDKIIIFKPKHGKNPLSIVTKDGEETYFV